MAKLILTACDHEQNGFVSIVQWSNLTELEARDVIERIDGEITDEIEPDLQTAPFTFILDLMDGEELVDTGKRQLPMQTAMRLSPDHVQRWLNERPVPDDVFWQATPEAARAALEVSS